VFLTPNSPSLTAVKKGGQKGEKEEGGRRMGRLRRGCWGMYAHVCEKNNGSIMKFWVKTALTLCNFYQTSEWCFGSKMNALRKTEKHGGSRCQAKGHDLCSVDRKLPERWQSTAVIHLLPDTFLVRGHFYTQQPPGRILLSVPRKIRVFLLLINRHRCRRLSASSKSFSFRLRDSARDRTTHWETESVFQ